MPFIAIPPFNHLEPLTMLRINRHSLFMALAAVAIVIAWHFGIVDPDAAMAVGMAGITMNTAGARVVDPVLTTVAQGYKNGQMVADWLFPRVPVGQRGGKIISFGKEDFMLYATARAPGANTKRIQFGYAGLPFALEQHALEAVVPFEIWQDAAAVPGIDMASTSVRKVQNIIYLSREVAAAAIALNAANYDANHKMTLAGADKWSDYSGTSDPLQDVDDAIEAVRATTGQRPNVVVLSPKAFKAAKRHPKIVDTIKYTGKDHATKEMLAAAFGVEHVVIGDALYFNGNAMTDVWGSDVVVGFTQLGSLAEAGAPSYGYTYQLDGFPNVEQPYHDRSAKSWIYPVTDELSPVLASAISGFLIKGAA